MRDTYVTRGLGRLASRSGGCGPVGQMTETIMGRKKKIGFLRTCPRLPLFACARFWFTALGCTHTVAHALLFCVFVGVVPSVWLLCHVHVCLPSSVEEQTPSGCTRGTAAECYDLRPHQGKKPRWRVFRARRRYMAVVTTTTPNPTRLRDEKKTFPRLAIRKLLCAAISPTIPC